MALAANSLTRAQDELDRYLATVQGRIDDPARPLAERQALALEAASALDRAAQDGRDAGRARAAWERAARLLEAFAATGGMGPTGASALRLQAAIYRWAQARTFLVHAELNPRDATAADEAARGLDAAIAALRPLAAGGEDRVGVEARFRLAQARADRAAVERDPARRQAFREEALASLPPPLSAFGDLAGHPARLRAEILLDLGRPAEALPILEQFRDAEPHPELAGQRARALAATGRLDEARAVVEAAAPAGASREGLLVPALIAAAEAAPAGQARVTLAREALALVARQTGAPGRRARLLAARSLAVQGGDLDVPDRETLADGLALLGRPADAAAVLEDRLTGSDPDAEGRLRYRAALLRREAGDPAGARAQLAAVLARPEAAAWHPRAQLATALLHAGSPPDREALRAVFERYPASPEAGEARFLLGGELAADLGDDEAQRLWEAIPANHPRYRDAVDARIDLALTGLEEAHAVGDADRVARRERTETLLSRVDGANRDPAMERDVRIARLRLKLIEWMDRSRRAEMDVDVLRRLPLSPEERDRLEMLRAGWLVRSGQHADGERLARSRFTAMSDAVLLEGGERLERIASGSTLDVERRRLGAICGEAARVVRERRDVSGWDRVRAALLASRAAVHRGDAAAAATPLAGLDVAASTLPARPRLALAETRLRAGLVGPALADYDAMGRLAAPGTALWREAKLGAARTHLAAGRPEAARQVLDAAAVLDPGLRDSPPWPRFEAVRRQASRR
jgi:TolA-binding protein